MCQVLVFGDAGLEFPTLGLFKLHFSARSRFHTHGRSRANLGCMDNISGCQRMPPFSMTDARSLRGLLGQQGCRDNEMQDVETKAGEEGNTADCTLEPRREEADERKESFSALLS